MSTTPQCIAQDCAAKPDASKAAPLCTTPDTRDRARHDPILSCTLYKTILFHSDMLPSASRCLQCPLGMCMRPEWLKWDGPVLICLGVGRERERGEEQDVAPVVLLRWEAWEATAGKPPLNLRLEELYGMMIEPDATTMGSGPHLLRAALPDWDILVYANRKAYDNHINILGSCPSSFFRLEGLHLGLPYSWHSCSLSSLLFLRAPGASSLAPSLTGSA